MVKVKVKKNIKPKITKQKQKQTQKTNVTVNIGTNIIKKKRGRPPTKKAKTDKQPTQAISPIIQSYNQPIFKQATPQQPSSLTSSILATQEKPKVIKEEVKEESTIKKALIDQNLSTDEPISSANDLERVRNARVKKVDVVKEVKKEKPFRSAILSQLLSEQGDDTEEIQALSPRVPSKSKQFTPLSRLRPQIATNPLVNLSSSTETPILTQENKEPDLFSVLETVSQEPIIEEPLVEEEQGSQEEILKNQQQEPEPSLLQSIEATPASQNLDISIVEPALVKLTPAKQIEKKWNELRNSGPLQSSKPTIEGKRKTSVMLLNEIRSVEPSWDTSDTRRKPGPKPRTIVPSRNNLIEEI